MLTHPATSTHRASQPHPSHSTQDAASQAISFLIVIAVARTLVTKWLLSGDREFSYPVFYSAVSCIATVAAIIVICILGGFDLHMLQKRHLASFTWVAVLTALDMGATNIAVESISVALQQTIKASLPVMVVLLEMTTMVSETGHACLGWPRLMREDADCLLHTPPSCTPPPPTHCPGQALQQVRLLVAHPADGRADPSSGGL